MPIIGLNFDKIGAKKDNKITGKLEIKNNIKISSVEQEKLSLTNSEDILKISFEFKVAYEPKIGGIQINGHILYMDEPKKIDDISKIWKKNKGLPKELSAQVINAILAKCNIKSLMLSQDVNLPPNIKLPMAKLN
ncbi:hypothetical protein HOG16_03185 [Candidatus Woesearchaeota archaeon]|jgi:hypothetical protein|nr:hypothetical protein [Candidatus Woesearchaeota archaeon]MBT4322138.1 hypothetical protein [Candidatus Woesearchaeota archaeon]MBT4630974.1 hypothetical protein [Candidatus Woesearchaeota archaeon]